MIEFLQGYVKKRGGAAPIWVVLNPGGLPDARVLKAVDAAGVVLQGGEYGEAYPWHAIYKIAPKP